MRGTEEGGGGGGGAVARGGGGGVFFLLLLLTSYHPVTGTNSNIGFTTSSLFVGGVPESEAWSVCEKHGVCLVTLV